MHRQVCNVNVVVGLKDFHVWGALPTAYSTMDTDRLAGSYFI